MALSSAKTNRSSDLSMWVTNVSFFLSPGSRFFLPFLLRRRRVCEGDREAELLRCVASPDAAGASAGQPALGAVELGEGSLFIVAGIHLAGDERGVFCVGAARAQSMLLVGWFSDVDV